jgi:RNA-directed DNA polymerase
MHEFDKFVKHELKTTHYLRYCDDFIILSNDKQYLVNLLKKIEVLLESSLKLKLHEHKITIRKLKQGIDFLGYVVLPHYTVLRTKTKRRMVKRLNKNNTSSYLGLLSHCNSFELKQELLKLLDQES